jgi:predicted SAM-dependent methyltransferase
VARAKAAPDEELGEYTETLKTMAKIYDVGRRYLLHSPTKLDIACGQNKAEGFTGIDLAGDADIVHDLFSFPWPIADGVVEEVNCSHFVEHIPHALPGQTVDGWWLFWDEVHRITKPGAVVNVTHPYVKSDRAFWDPTHVRFIHEQTWYYLDAEWRKAQGLDHYPVTADFNVVTISGSIADDIATRALEVQTFARAHYWNALGDLTIRLERR